MFEMEGIPEADARKALKLAADKLPIHSKILVRQEI
jgi:large subunit ribosomal protein L16